jgi:hypothetical protein
MAGFLTTEDTEGEHREARRAIPASGWFSILSRGCVRIAFLCAALFGAVASTAACPFCTALKPTLCERRESAALVVVAELASQEGASTKVFRVVQALTGKERLAGAETLRIPVDFAAKSGSLALLFAEGDAKSPLEKLEWSAVAVNETSLAYVARAPSLRTNTDKRLTYFVPFLEHADATIAEDVYQEFGHAPLDKIISIADQLPFAKLRTWLVDPTIPQERKGFFGVVLGIAKTDADRRANLAVLRQVIDAKESDFRAGFDGVLGGYLLLEGERALADIGKRFFANPNAAEGDVRHAISAVRFYYEHDRAIDRERFREALRPLVDRPEFAMTAILDLARWKDWSLVAKVAKTYDAAGYPQPATREAAVAYLIACPENAAGKALAELRGRDPKGVAAAELKLGPIAPTPQ